MLSQNSLDNLAIPFVERQQYINRYIVEQIAKRIKEIGTLSPSDVAKLITLRNSGADVRKLNNEIAKITNLQLKDIQDMIRYVANDAYLDAKPFYDYREMPFVPLEQNLYLNLVVESIAKQTQDMYINLSKNVAFMYRDMRTNKLIPCKLSEYYTKVTDTAIQAVVNGTVDYNTAMRQTLKDLSDYGMRVVYYPESGRVYTQRMDTAVRRNILDGVREINQGVQDEVGKQFGADGVELSVHQYPAEDHAPVQGHQFYKEEYDKMNNGEPFQDVQGRRYQSFDRAIGTLNCRHFAFNIIVGEAKQNYTDEQLKEIIQQNDEGYTLPNGKHLTLYECTQKMREYETKIRYAKDGQIASVQAGNEDLALYYQHKITELTSKYKAFCSACGLQPMMNKARVMGYKRIKAKSLQT